MIEMTFVNMIEISLTIITGAAIVIIITATIYDLRMIAQKKRLQSVTSKLKRSRQPKIVIIIYAHNNAQTLVSCLESVKKLDYVNLQITVADNASKDETRQILSTFMRRNKRRSVEHYVDEDYTPKQIFLSHVQKMTQDCDLSLIIDATDTLPPALLKNIAAHFSTDNSLHTLQLRRHAAARQTIDSLPNQFLELSRNVLLKATARSSVATPHRLQPGIVIRNTRSTPTKRVHKPHSDYASNLLINSSNDQERYSPLSWRAAFKLPMTLIALASISYFFYTAATLQSNTLLTLSWLIVGGWLLAVTWSDEILPMATKFELSMTVPFMYFVIYIKAWGYFLHTLKAIISSVPMPIINLKNLQIAIQSELYSTRY